MTTPPCTHCKHCTDIDEDDNQEWWIYCDFDETWMTAEYAFSDLDCDMFEQKLDDNETKEHTA